MKFVIKRHRILIVFIRNIKIEIATIFYPKSKSKKKGLSKKCVEISYNIFIEK